MRVTLTSTTRIVDVVAETGAVVPGRVWEGRTDSGIPVFAVVTRIAARDDDATDLSQFEAELQRCADPTPESLAAIPARLVL